MTALILNSGVGSRMGDLILDSHKSLVKISDEDTILSSEIKNLLKVGIDRFVITTGPNEQLIKDEVEKKFRGQANFIYVNNDVYKETNYIYSIFLAREYLDDDIISLHGDLVFEYSVLADLIQNNNTAMIVSSTTALPEKDFKAVVDDGRIKKIAINVFQDAVAAQPLYYLKKEHFVRWLDIISKFIAKGENKCYAENALNEILDSLELYAFDVEDRLCGEIDTAEDLKIITERWKNI